jgi:hypothetical protein
MLKIDEEQRGYLLCNLHEFCYHFGVYFRNFTVYLIQTIDNKLQDFFERSESVHVSLEYLVQVVRALDLAGTNGL